MVKVTLDRNRVNFEGIGSLEINPYNQNGSVFPRSTRETFPPSNTSWRTNRNTRLTNRNIHDAVRRSVDSYGNISRNSRELEVVGSFGRVRLAPEQSVPARVEQAINSSLRSLSTSELADIEEIKSFEVRGVNRQIVGYGLWTLDRYGNHETKVFHPSGRLIRDPELNNGWY
jgi:hypothetical protein